MKIICVGRNYAEHAKELNNPVPDDPVIFLKPDSSLLRNNDDFYLPEYSNDVHHECELVLRVGKEGKYVDRRFGTSYIDAVGLGIDFTARDLQTKAKEKGLPWTLAKGFHGSAPVSQFKDVSHYPDLRNLRFELQVNGETRQQGWTGDMIFDLGFLVEFITRFMVIKKGDLIFTGTPKGVARVQSGDHLVGTLEGERLLDFHVR
jgi:2-keto-4-pentenoate hydratase/2-oxohepta-3-ene-1,7-dioic acid hydratase in catechol pathway